MRASSSAAIFSSCRSGPCRTRSPLPGADLAVGNAGDPRELVLQNDRSRVVRFDSFGVVATSCIDLVTSDRPVNKSLLDSRGTIE
jgi:hypothetical protein